MSDLQSDEPRLQRALDTLNSLLTSGETVEAWATQRRVFALKHRRVLLAATTGRFIALTRRLIGGYDSADIRKLTGVKSAQIQQTLGYTNGDAIIHRNNLVLLT